MSAEQQQADPASLGGIMHALNQPLQVIETGVFVAREIVEDGLDGIAAELSDLQESLEDTARALIEIRQLTEELRGALRAR